MTRRSLWRSSTGILTILATAPVLALAAVVLAAPPAHAQQRTFTLPAGFDQVEGNSMSTYPLSMASGRFQQIAAPVPQGTNLVQLALRRDGDWAPFPFFPSVRVDVTIRMGPGAFERFGSEFARNWVGGAPVDVFTRKPVSLPNWAAKPLAPPAAWDLAFPFDRPFQVPANRDLVWELVLENGSHAFPMFPADAQASTYAVRASRRLGVGCSTANGSLTLDSIAQTYANDAVALRYRVVGGPAQVPIVLALGSRDPDFGFGACTTLRTSMDGLITVLGGTDAWGRVPWVCFHWHWRMWAAGPPVDVPIYAQAVAVDPSQPGPLPVLMSNGSLSTVAKPFQGVDRRTMMLFAPDDPQAASGLLEYRIGAVTRFTH